MPKVIDFGLAKLMAPELADGTLTEIGTVLGTPAYASPEQMSLSGIDVDTRSDVYSLGVLLYELLIGVIPFEAPDTQADALVELRRSIRDVEPTRPSARLSRLGERGSLVAKARCVDTFLQETLGSADPWQTGTEISMRETLRRAAAKVDASFKSEPLIAAAVHRTIGKAYFGLGQFTAAERELRVALNTREQVHGREHADIAECLADLSALYQEKGDYAAADTVSAEALAMRRKLFADSSDVRAASAALQQLDAARQGAK